MKKLEIEFPRRAHSPNFPAFLEKFLISKAPGWFILSRVSDGQVKPDPVLTELARQSMTELGFKVKKNDDLSLIIKR